MKVSIAEAWKHAKKIIGSDLKKVSIVYSQDKTGNPEIQWDIMDNDYNSGRAESFHEAIYSLKAKIDSKKKPEVTDIVINSEKEVVPEPAKAEVEPETTIKEEDLPF